LRERLTIFALRNSGEQNISFDDFILETQKQGREIVLIVDESHIAKTTELAEEIIDLLNPKIQILVSASPHSQSCVVFWSIQWQYS